jgi:hypothetical protein
MWKTAGNAETTWEDCHSKDEKSPYFPGETCKLNRFIIVDKSLASEIEEALDGFLESPNAIELDRYTYNLASMLFNRRPLFWKELKTQILVGGFAMKNFMDFGEFQLFVYDIGLFKHCMANGILGPKVRKARIGLQDKMHQDFARTFSSLLRWECVGS